jgi:mono/diheme cytochrome c family protein
VKIRVHLWTYLAGIALAIDGGAAVATLPPAATTQIDFDRDIAPILERACWSCHGPEKQKGGFRLDQRADALAGGDNYAPAIIPGQSEKSPLIQFVAGLDPDMKMPRKGDPLSHREVGLLRAWIDQGAVWNRSSDVAANDELTHWSFRPLTRPVAPESASASEPNAHPIDQFLAAKLKANGLQFRPEADRTTMIRRLYFDVIGLPPTIAQVEAFLRDPDPNAYVKLVDELLASPHYGERWARHWLDVVRFAESDGFETNQPRPNAWPYRDWVIGAFNDDKPFDRFIVAQLAGDVFGEDAATGFLVGGPVDRVKSPDPVLTAQQRADELHDMVSTTGSAFLGLTIGCARCHNHKFDPITQTDYYAMKAVFAGVQHGERPLRRADDDTRRTQTALLQKELGPIIAQLAQQEPIARLSRPATSQEFRDPVTRGENIERFAPRKARFVKFLVRATTQLEPCIDELEVFTAGDHPRNVALATAGTRATSSGNYDGNPSHKLAHINDGEYGNERSWISNETGKGWVQLEFPESIDIERVHWSRDRARIPRYEDRTATSYEVSVSLDGVAWEVVASSIDRLPFGSPRPVQKTEAGDDRADARSAFLRRRVEIETRLRDLDNVPSVYAGKFAAPEETFRFHRGDPMQPRERVAPGGPAKLGGPHLALDTSEQTRRLALAEWIASPSNPLTARVLVNRLWHYHFGAGLVNTPSDFGRNGARPSHPELLDWLASEFIARGWSVKQMQRLIVTSRAFRQSSASDAAALTMDRNANLLWRFNPRRLEAEPLRDAILAITGSLDLRVGGPGFDLFEPNTNYVKVYNSRRAFGPETFRRMIYQMKPRMQLDDTFGGFDCPDAGQIAPKRNRSTTPLQALAMLNSPFFNAQAERFAERLRSEAPSDVSGQITVAFQLAFSRAPEPDELAEACALVRGHGLVPFCRAMLNANELIQVF